MKLINGARNSEIIRIDAILPIHPEDLFSINFSFTSTLCFVSDSSFPAVDTTIFPRNLLRRLFIF